MGDLNITNYFVSDEFFKVVKKIKNVFGIDYCKIENVDYLISLAVKYAIANGEPHHPSLDGVSEFLIDVLESTAKILKDNENYNDIVYDNSMHCFAVIEEVDKNIKRKLITPILKKLGKDEFLELDEDTKKEVFRQVFTNYYLTDYKYHSFNSNFLDSIKKNGIDPNLKMTSQEDINRINDIFVRHGIDRIFGWQKGNCEGKVFYSQDPTSIFSYGISSPEWFSQFVGESTSYRYQEGLVEDAFAIGDYSSAQNNLLNIMKINNFSGEEVEEVMHFFEKEWEKYGCSSPMVAIIPNDDRKELTEESIECYYNVIYNFHCPEGDIESIIKLIIDDEKNDVGTTECINTSNAIFINLPSKQQILKECFEFKEEDFYYSREEFFKIYELLNSNSKGSSYDPQKFINSAIRYLNKTSLTELLKTQKDFLQNIISNSSDEIIKKVTLLAPECVKELPGAWKYNINFMRACARQKGIQPALLCYVGEDVREDITFISNLIINSTIDTFDFYDQSKTSTGESCLKYSDFIGPAVQKNPLFWDLLNLKIRSINEQTGQNLPYFDKEIEMGIVERKFENVTKIATSK